MDWLAYQWVMKPLGKRGMRTFLVVGVALSGTLSLCLLAESGALAQDYEYNPGFLADEIDGLPLEISRDHGDPFGAPGDAEHAIITEGSSGLTFSEIEIPMNGDVGRSSLFFRIFPDAATAQSRFQNSLVTRESRLKGGGYRISTSTVQAWYEERSLDLSVKCAHRPTDGGPVTEVRCAYLAEGSQTIVGTYTRGQDLSTRTNEILTEDLVLNSFVIDVSQPIVDGLDLLAKAEAALVDQGSEAAWPPGGWQLDTQALIRHLRAMAFFGREDWPASFGSPHGLGVERPTKWARDRGVAGIVTLPLNTRDAMNGLEFWVFETAAQRHADDMQFSFLSAAQGRQAGTVDTTTFTETSFAGDGHDRALTDITCGRVKVDPREGRCVYKRPGSQVALVVYRYGPSLDDKSGAWDDFNDDAVQAIRVGLDKLAEAEAPLVAALREGRPPPAPGLKGLPQSQGADPGAQTHDEAFVGTWQLYLPMGAGFARLQLAFNPDGSYAFTSDSPAVDQHSGRFTALSGVWSIVSPTWRDEGTYSFPDPNTMILTGKLGPGVWSRVN